ncbi:MAG TPA: cytochrome b/b6 domain-containing protein [Casimicrobiaceae bacterium]|jgi:thiosulfate reductase cytochrome b subunit
MNDATVPASRSASIAGRVYYRHQLPVRIMHWINVIALTILFMSGLMIFNAHSSLYWGKSSYTGRPPILEIGARDGGETGAIGYTKIFGREFNTTGVLGLSREPNGRMAARAFPSWLTIPDVQWLSMARSWHFFFAWIFVVNGLCYVAYSLWSRHLARDLLPTRSELAKIGQSIKDHLLFRHETGEAATRYNVLQKITYLIVIFVLLPLVILMGFAMSPRIDTLFTGWVDLFGGRQSARTIHFIAAWLIVAFVLIHVFEVIITGLWNNLRSMITGRYRVPPEPSHE